MKTKQPKSQTSCLSKPLSVGLGIGMSLCSAPAECDVVISVINEEHRFSGVSPLFAEFHFGPTSISFLGAASVEVGRLDDANSAEPYSTSAPMTGQRFMRAFGVSDLIPATPSTGTAGQSLFLAFNLDFSIGTGEGHFFNVGPQIAGFTFNAVDEFGNSVLDGDGNQLAHAGAILASVSIDTVNQEGIFFIDRIAYESTPGVSLPASAVPEFSPPVALGLLATGVAGWRRRKQIQGTCNDES